MTTPKVQAQTLLDEVLPFAEQMLCNYGEFLPYAGALRPSGEIVSISGFNGREHPPSKEVIDLLADGLRNGGSTGEYVAKLSFTTCASHHRTQVSRPTQSPRSLNTGTDMP